MTILQQNKQYITENIAKSRDDGRKHDQTREISIETGILGKAEGSARVQIGKTEVIVGVKVDIGTPFPDTPKSGVLMVNSEFSALASPEFENGPPREDSIELSRVVDRGIRESNTIAVEDLCIEPGEKVWMVFVDINITNHDGNLIDAAGMAAIAALMSAKVPKINEDGTVNRDGEYKGSLPVKDIPVPVSVGIINSTMIVDATKLEEQCIDSRITITTTKAGNYCAMQQAGSHETTEEQILKIGEIAQKNGKERRLIIEKSVKK